MTLNDTQKKLRRRILEISHKHHLSHLGSNLTAVDIIWQIYQTKKPDEKFVLSSGHAGLALYVVLEEMGFKDAEAVFEHHGVHPDRCEECHLDCSTGSLGQGLPIAVGMALADRSKNVYCLISDGECGEGSIWEALRVIGQEELTNLKVYCNYNGWAAYRSIDWRTLPPEVKWCRTNVDDFPFLKALDAHYHVMTDQEYNTAMEVLK